MTRLPEWCTRWIWDRWPAACAEMDEWDRQMIADSKAGKFDRMAEQARADHEAGLCDEWPTEGE